MFTFYLTPIDEEHIHMRSLVTMKKTGRAAGHLAADAEGLEGRPEDHRPGRTHLGGQALLPRPGLAEDDGPIMASATGPAVHGTYSLRA